jgi:UTP--glucose-1-phosphate uridylyltransferase
MAFKTNDKKFAPFATRMEAEGLPEIVIKTFEYYYNQLAEGQTGLIPEDDISPIGSLPDIETLSPELAQTGQAVLSKAVLMKLNGGLGTGMGLEKSKSLLVVKEGLSFLDIIARQAQSAGVPLILMNSFNTQKDSLAVLSRYPDLQHDIPLDFLQHKVPKVTQDDLSPAIWPQDPELEWCPPGHGDIYAALITSGMLDRLVEAGYEYGFVSNADNLGAVLDAKLLGYFVEQQLPFMMEVADRTEADKKGGHLARRPDGQLLLREIGQCPPDDLGHFQDITRHKYFNTNNLWLNLPILKNIIAAKDNILGLPMIRNRKTIDPRDPTSMVVYQLETAMGSAIASFPGSGAIRVPRSRFAPVKTTADLLVIRSDAYILTDDFRVVPNPARKSDEIVVSLDEAYYKLVDKMESRFPYGAPSLVACERLTIKGDIKFGRNITIKGKVHLANNQTQQREIGGDMIIVGG